MAEGVQSELVQATQVIHEAEVRMRPTASATLPSANTILSSVIWSAWCRPFLSPSRAPSARKTYYFVPLALSDRRGGEATLVAPAYTPELGDQAICHRNVNHDGTEAVFISTRLLGDRFALAFEFFINIGHAFVDVIGVPEAFDQLVWGQALADVRGETSLDAWESRNLALSNNGHTGESRRQAGRSTRRPATTSSNRHFPTRLPSTSSRSQSTSTTRSCASASIRCLPRRLSPTASASLPGSFHRTPATSSLSATAAALRPGMQPEPRERNLIDREKRDACDPNLQELWSEKPTRRQATWPTRDVAAPAKVLCRRWTSPCRSTPPFSTRSFRVRGFPFSSTSGPTGADPARPPLQRSRARPKRWPDRLSSSRSTPTRTSILPRGITSAASQTSLSFIPANSFANRQESSATK